MHASEADLVSGRDRARCLGFRLRQQPAHIYQKYMQDRLSTPKMMAVFAASAFGAATAQTSSASCPAVFNDTLPAATEVHLQGAHQMAVLARKLEETEHLLHISHSHPPGSGFRYGTFLCGMLLAVLLMGTAALLSWEYIRKQLQRKQQVAVVGGLKDMDDKTLKKVLGSVRFPSLTALSIIQPVTCTKMQHGFPWLVQSLRATQCLHDGADCRLIYPVG